MDTVVFVNDSVINFFENEMVLVKLNSEVDTVLKDEYKVSGLPTLILLGTDGKEIDRIIGAEPPDKFISTLRDYSEGIGTLSALLVEATDANDSLRNLSFEIADKYKYRGGEDKAKFWFEKVIKLGTDQDSLSGEARLAIADLYRRGKEYMKALVTYASIIDDFSDKPTAEEASLMSAIVYRQKGDTATAIGAFGDFVRNYPSSKMVGYARTQIEKLTEKIEEEAKKK